MKKIDKKYIIFDFDGTIINFPVPWEEIKRELDSLCLRYGLFTSNVGISEKLYCLRALKKEAEGLELLEEFEFKNLSKAIIDTKVRNFILDIKDSGKTLAIFSDNFRDTIEELISSEDLEVFDEIIGRQEVNLYKPYPDGFMRFENKYRFHKEEVLYIGDSNKDRIAAKIYGIQFKNINEILKRGLD